MSFALVVSLASLSQPDTEKAYADLRDIESILSAWDDSLLQRNIQNLLGQAREAVLDSFPLLVPLPIGDDTIHLELDRPDRVLFPRRLWHFAHPSGRMRAPRTLAEFRELWDALEGFTQLAEVTGIWDISMETLHARAQTREWRDWFSGRRRVPASQVRGKWIQQVSFGRITTDSIVRVYPWIPTDSAVYAWAAFVRSPRQQFGAPDEGRLPIVLLPDTRPLRSAMTGQRWIRQRYPEATDWKLGPFERTFPELNRIAGPFQGFSFSIVDTVVSVEARRSEEDLEVLGVRLPASRLAVWGSVLVVCIQVYLVLHLRALLTAVSVGGTLNTDAPWIGAYADWWSRGATLVLACLVPPLAVLWSAAESTTGAFVLPTVIAAACAVVLAASTVVTLWSLWGLDAGDEKS